jgi:2-polyprenyl-6-methoxyphenol hydroxylase-like FAD-dependent oxidoreductase
MDVDVIVAGAGPVGLMLASELRLGGASVLVLEREAEPDRELQGGAMGGRSVSTPTVDAFHRRGFLEEVRKAALWWFTPGQPIDPDAFVGHFAGLPLRASRLDLADPGRDASPLGGGAVPLLDLREILGRRALALGAEVRRATALTGLTAGPDGVTVQAGGAEVTARWLVGCDGGRSTVRRLAGIDFPGTDAEFTGRIATVTLAEPGSLPRCGWTRTAAGSYTHGPAGRVHVVEYGPVPADRSAPVTAAEMQASLSRVTGRPVAVTAVLTGTRYTDATRQAVTYRAGRVLLAGDAAHIHSPAGGQGLNLGLGDAFNLGWKLAAAVRGQAPDSLLDTYTAERHPIGAWVQGWSDAQTALGRPDHRSEALRDVIRDLLDTPQGATYVLKQISGTGPGNDLPGSGPVTGRRAPDLTLPDGTTLADHSAGARPILVTRSGPAPEAAPWSGWLLTLAGPADLLIRPDGIVAWSGDGDLTTALTTWLGPPPGSPAEFRRAGIRLGRHS